MDFRVAPQAETDLDEIWYFLATQSSSIEVADRVIDSITARFALSHADGTSAAAATKTCDEAYAVRGREYVIGSRAVPSERARSDHEVATNPVRELRGFLSTQSGLVRAHQPAINVDTGNRGVNDPITCAGRVFIARSGVVHATVPL